MEPEHTPFNFHKHLPKLASKQAQEETEARDKQIPFPRFRDYICEGMGKQEDEALKHTHSSLKLEFEALQYAHLKDNGNTSSKARLLALGTPLMPYTEPSFVNECIIEQQIEEQVNRISLEPTNSKKRSRQQFDSGNTENM